MWQLPGLEVCLLPLNLVLLRGGRLNSDSVLWYPVFRYLRLVFQDFTSFFKQG